MMYICTHTDFAEHDIHGTILSKVALTNQYKQPVVVVDSMPLQRSMCEGVQISWMQIHAKDDYIGLSQYRRYFTDIPPHKTVLPKPIKKNLELQYAKCHNLDDLRACESIIDRLFPEYATDYALIDVIYPHNMFVMSSEDFKEYARFVLGVLRMFCLENNLTTDDDVIEHVKRNIKHYYNRDVAYQSRLLGFLLERLSTIFYTTYYKGKDVEYKDIVTISDKKN